MDRSSVQDWLDRYSAAWLSYDEAAIRSLFAPDARYRYHPYDPDEDTVAGVDAIANNWLDNRDTPAADHIVMVHSFDATTNTLYTIGGNDSGYQVDTGKHKQATGDQAKLEAATGQPLKPGGGNHSVAVNAYDVKRVPQVRIYGIGRPSLVDFEDHRYDSTNPKHPPTG